MVYVSVSSKQLLAKHEVHRKRGAGLSMRPKIYYVLNVGVHPDHADL